MFASKASEVPSNHTADLLFCILAVYAGLVVGPLVGFALCAVADLSFH